MRGEGYMGEGHFPIGPMPRKAEPVKTENSITITLDMINTTRLGRAYALEKGLDWALGGLPDAEFVTITVYKWTDAPTEFTTRETC